MQFLNTSTIKRLILLCILPSFLLLSCKSKSPYQTENLHGIIFNFDNEPVDNVKIELYEKKPDASETETQGTVEPFSIFEVYTDIHGQFNLGELKKNCEYELLLTKELYEKKSFSFTYTDPTQILYIQLYSAEQYLQLAEQEIKKNNMQKAIIYLETAKSAGANPVISEYLHAVIYFKQGDYQKAISILEQLIDKGSTESYIYLFLADMYQYKIEDLDKAELYLKRYLENMYDPSVSERLQALP